MTAMTTILAMMQLIIGKGMGSQMGRGMAIVIASGLIYATLMTLYIIPVMYDIFFRRAPLSVDVGDDLEDAPDDAAEFIAEMEAEKRRGGRKEKGSSKAAGGNAESEENEDFLYSFGSTVEPEEDEDFSGFFGSTVEPEESEDSLESSGFIVDPGEYEDFDED